MPVDYQGGKIYTIRSPETDKYYIGSTTQTLPKRFYEHKKDYERFQDGKKHNITSFQILELEGAYIELLELYPTNSKAELERREGQLIRENRDNCVNRCIAGRTNKEYKKDNKQHLLEKAKDYRAANKEALNAKAREKVMCGCGASLSRRNISAHRKSKKHQKAMKEETE